MIVRSVFAVSCPGHHVVRLWRSPRRWPHRATNHVQIRWKFLSLVSGKTAVFDKTDSLVTQYRMAQTNRMPYLYRLFSAKEPYN